MARNQILKKVELSDSIQPLSIKTSNMFIPYISWDAVNACSTYQDLILLNSNSKAHFQRKSLQHISVATFLDSNKMNLYPLPEGRNNSWKGHSVRDSPKSLTACQAAYPGVHMFPQKYKPSKCLFLNYISEKQGEQRHISKDNNHQFSHIQSSLKRLTSCKSTQKET